MVDFLAVFNAVASSVKFKPVSFTEEQVSLSLDDLGLDSLDKLMCTIYVCEIYGIPEEVGKGIVFKNIQEMLAFVAMNKTKDPESIEAVEAMLK